MSVLPPIGVGSGITLVLRARAGGIFMLNEITRRIGYKSPVLNTDVQNTTEAMEPAPDLFNNPRNPARSYFVSWADADQYDVIDVMLSVYVNNFKIEVISTTVVP